MQAKSERVANTQLVQYRAGFWTGQGKLAGARPSAPFAHNWLARVPHMAGTALLALARCGGRAAQREGGAPGPARHHAARGGAGLLARCGPTRLGGGGLLAPSNTPPPPEGEVDCPARHGSGSLTRRGGGCPSARGRRSPGAAPRGSGGGCSPDPARLGGGARSVQHAPRGGGRLPSAARERAARPARRGLPVGTRGRAGRGEGPRVRFCTVFSTLRQIHASRGAKSSQSGRRAA